MKTSSTIALAVAVAALVATSAPLRASETDDRIETSFKTTYVYKTYLKDEHVKISAKDGVVTLTGSVADENHKTMAVDTAEALPGVMAGSSQAYRLNFAFAHQHIGITAVKSK